MEPFGVIKDIGYDGSGCGIGDEVVLVGYREIFVFVVDVSLGEMVGAGDGV